MKQIMLLIITVCLGLQLQSQVHREHQLITLDVSGYDEIQFYNKHGKVDVRGVKGDDMRIEGERILRAKSNKKLEEAKAQIFLDTFTVGNALVVFINNPFYRLDGDYDDGFMHYTTYKKYQNTQFWKKKYVNFEFDIQIDIPHDSNLKVRTHSGDLTVRNLQGRLAASNHHDDIMLHEVLDVTDVHTHHGDISVSLIESPSADVAFSSHHGDISVSVPSEPSAMIHFDSHHGDFYTDFDWRNVPRSRHEVSVSNIKTKYKLSDKTLVQMLSLIHI